VQEEMIASTGEAAITREQYIPGHGHNYNLNQPKDPVTGRFIKKNQNQTED
jgi:hypothetical protein